MKDRELHKNYLCVVHGVPKEKEATLEGFLFKDEKKNKVTVLKNEVKKRANCLRFA